MNTQKAMFAGGCFWCMQPPYDTVLGVLSTTVGYSGGKKPNPTYEDICRGDTGHAEVVVVEYNADEISYERLLDVFWRNIDPTALNRQFADSGTQYRTGIYYYNEEQKKSALASKEKLEKSGRFKEKIVTEILPVAEFFPAEEYHQCYYQKNSAHYNMYKYGSGRVDFIQKVWGS
jgi:methionine-S-sulfoxide reductase